MIGANLVSHLGRSIWLGVWGGLVAASIAHGQESGTSDLRSLVGRIAGLDSHGLTLMDGLGTVVRPFAGAKEFAFKDGQPYIRPDEQVQLSVARQPVGQTCRVSAEGGDDQSDTQQALVVCVTVPQSPMIMRDCFQVLSSGASFTLGRKVDGVWLPFADVTMDPVGSNRLHHRTLIDGKVVLETITYLPDDRPRAIVEMHSGDSAVSGQVLDASSKQDGMPLDLAVGEERSYSVIDSRHPARPTNALGRSSQRRWVKFLGVGPLETRAGRFPMTCHLRERSEAPEATQAWDVWYAPGYGPVRIQAMTESGVPPSFSLEVTEIQRRPR